MLNRFSHVLLFLTPWTIAHHRDSPGKNTGVGCHALLQSPLSIGLFKQKILKYFKPSSYKLNGDFKRILWKTHTVAYSNKFFFKLNLLILIGGKLLYNIVLVLPYINMNPPQVYMFSQSWTRLPPPSPYHPLGHPSAPVPSILYPVSNLDWRFISYMILYRFQCHSPKSSHPFPLPQSPKDCSIHLCLFCCLAYRVIITIFLNSIYMCYYTVLVFFFVAYFTLYNRLQFHPPH